MAEQLDEYNLVCMFTVYILRCSDNTLYCGQTNNLARRIKLHNEGKGAKYTRGRGPVLLEYSEKFKTVSTALKREAVIKKMTRREKELLIQGKKARKG